MDGTVALRHLCARGRARFSSGGAIESRPRWLAHRRRYLADEFWHDREGSLDRDRGALRFAFRARDCLLVKLVAGKTVALAHLDRAVHFFGARTARKRAS